MSQNLNQQLLRLSTLLGLQSRARKTSIEELGFLMVNETMNVVVYKQAVFWRNGRGIVSLSGVASPEKGAPYIRWLKNLINFIKKDKTMFTSMHVIDKTKLPFQLKDSWVEWLPEYCLWCPMKDVRGPILGGLIFARDEPWDEGDAGLISLLIESYTQNLAVAATSVGRIQNHAVRPWIRNISIITLLMGIINVGFIPIRSTVLAPAEIVPANPSIVRSPFSGVIDSIAVLPNQNVEKGQIVLNLDTRQLITQHEVAQKTLEASMAEYQQASQEAMLDPKARARAALLLNKIDENKAEAYYRKNLLERAEVHASASGVAVFDNPSDWIGKPVESGERIMLISPPQSSRLEIQVPIGDAATFEVGADVLFFDDVTPDHPTAGKVVFSSYGSSITPEGVLSYALRADLDNIHPIRLGMKGTAKVFGPSKPLLLWILRKPINTMRQWLTL